jgi:hypothetical protein
MANRKNTSKRKDLTSLESCIESARAAAWAAPPDSILGITEKARRFVADHPENEFVKDPAFVELFELCDGNEFLALLPYFAHLETQAEQSKVDATIAYLDPSASA